MCTINHYNYTHTKRKVFNLIIINQIAMYYVFIRVQ